MTSQSDELLRGTLDALILKTLTWGPRHGYGIARWIKASGSPSVLHRAGLLRPRHASD
jgi:PadR family transcriptional regulator